MKPLLQTLRGVGLIATMGLAPLPAIATNALPADDFSDVILLGGQTTIVQKYPGASAFNNPASNLTTDQVDEHNAGDVLFEQKFSDDPARPDYGLGPVYNNISCQSCHTLDGRGSLPVMQPGNAWTTVDGSQTIFLRISLEDGRPRRFDAQDGWGAPRPVPGYGTQLFQAGTFNIRSDYPGIGQARLQMKYEYSTFTYPDGTQVQLRRPIFKVDEAYDALNGDRLHQPDVRFSPRGTPPMIGLGLLEAIRERDILALAARDLRAWGVHGHPNWVMDRQKQLAGDPIPISLGRFGLKANTPTVFHQTLGALQGDMGVTNPAFPDENISGTALFDAFKQYWKPGLQATAQMAEQLVFYSSTLAVPSRRTPDDADVRAGGKLFRQVGCANCHEPMFVTGPHKIGALAGQTIYPFTDLLLHDMGDGLADGRTDFRASGREWRTRPLWGIGDAQAINARAGFLHDSRATSTEEAILWHDGEAHRSRAAFARLSLNERNQLLAFLDSL